MKRKYLIKLVIMLCTLSFSICISSCYTRQMQKYYEQKDNYICSSGIVSFVNYDEKENVLYVGFSELSDTFSDNCFKIIGSNLEIAQTNGIDSKLMIGSQADFTTAPKYFGDGYVMPIVELFINGECILDFESGYENLLDWLESEQ